MNPYTFFANLLDLIPETPQDSILSRTLYADDSVKAVLFGFAPGQDLSEHTAALPAVIYIVQGEGSLTLGGDTLEARAGTWVRIEPHLPHSVVARTPLVMLLLLLRSGS